MDEPLSNLDAKLRVQMRADIAALQARLGVTTVYVTHDQAEAMTLGHRVAVLQGRPAAAVRRAAGAVRAPGEHVRRRLHRLAGDEPLLDACRGRTARVSLGGVDVPRPAGTPARGRRASSSACGRRRSSSRADGIAARVEVVEELGADAYVFCAAELGGERRSSSRASTRGTRPSAASVSRCARAPRRRTSSTPQTGERLELLSRASRLDTPRRASSTSTGSSATSRAGRTHCDRAGLANRPHVKTHKCVEIARRQVALGAAGITCQTLREAETMVDAGIDDVLVPYNLVGERKLERLAALLGAGDDLGHRRRRGAPARASRARPRRPGRELGVLVDCDTGLGRTGVAYAGGGGRARGARSPAPGLRFDGFLTYPSPPGAPRVPREARRLATRRAGVEIGLGRRDADDVEGRRAAAVVTEYRAGTYAFHDRTRSPPARRRSTTSR